MAPLGATRQPGEPRAFGDASLPGTSWYRFSATLDADVVTVTGSTIPTFLTSALLGGTFVELTHANYGRLTFTVPPGARSGQIEISPHTRTLGAFTVTAG